VLAHGLATVNVAAIHAVGPNDIIGKRGQHAINIPRVEAFVDAFQDFDIIVHRALSSVVPVLHRGNSFNIHMFGRGFAWPLSRGRNSPAPGRADWKMVSRTADSPGRGNRGQNRSWR